MARYIYGGGTLNTLANNHEKQAYCEHDNHVMTGSSIKLMAYKVAAGSNAGAGCDGTLPYESGMLRSKTTVQYGYLEARVKVPGGRGVWPAFWLTPEDATTPPLVVIFNYVDNGGTDQGKTLHTEVQTDDAGAHGAAWTGTSNLADCFHVVALLWDDKSVTTYVDGTPIATRACQWVHHGGGGAGRAHILLNLAIGGSSGPVDAGPIDDSAFPQGLEVDYVRVYQKTTDTGTSTIGVDLCPDAGGC